MSKEPPRKSGTVFTRNGMLDTNTGTRFAYGVSSPIMARINNRVGVTRAGNRAAFNEGNALTRESRENMEAAIRRRDSELADIEREIEEVEARMEYEEMQSRSGLASNNTRERLRALYESRRRLL